MSYHHFNIIERTKIETLVKLNYSARSIAKELGRHHSNISKELKRAGNGNYSAEEAQVDYQLQRTNCGSKGKYTPKLAKTIIKKLKLTWSPEQIANTICKDQVSFKTIYNWLYKRKLMIGLSCLRHKGKSRKAADKRGKFAIGIAISERPADVETRETFGHWELDTMVSSRGKSKGCLATFIERKTRLYTALKIPDRSAVSMKSAIEQLLGILPKDSVQSFTTDRGKEFACHADINAKYEIPVYFADPYSSWQRGSNENANGLLREFYPKKTDLALIDQKELIHNLTLINTRPRKCLGWKTTVEAFLHEVSHLG